MARFDVYLNPDGEGWLVDVQADELSAYRTRIVVPLVPIDRGFRETSRLNPAFDTPRGRLVLATHLVFALPANVLGRPEFDLKSQQDRIKSALDMAFYGF